MANDRLKSLLQPVEGIDSILFIKFLYLLMRGKKRENRLQGYIKLKSGGF